MRVAIPIWDERVSPVFDVAQHLLLADVEGPRELGRTEQVLEQTEPASRAGRVADLGVDVLICGAISRPLEAMLISAGVRVIAQSCGAADDVLGAFLAGELTEQTFLMPGCRRRRRWSQGRRGRGPRRFQGESR